MHPAQKTRKVSNISGEAVACSRVPAMSRCRQPQTSPSPGSFEFPSPTLCLCRSLVVSFVAPNTGIGGGCSEPSGGQLTRGRLGFLINSRGDIVPSPGAPASLAASIPAPSLPKLPPCSAAQDSDRSREDKLRDGQEKQNASREGNSGWEVFFCPRISAGSQL